MSPEEKLINEAAVLSDPDRLYEIATLATTSVTFDTLARNDFIDFRTINLLGSQLQILLANEGFKKCTASCPNVPAQLFVDATPEMIKSLQISKDSDWWDYLLSHPSAKVRRAIAANPMLPANIEDWVADPGTDSAIQKGYAENVLAKPHVLKILAVRSNKDQVKAIAQAQLKTIETYKPTKTTALNFNVSRLQGNKKSLSGTAILLIGISFLSLGGGLIFRLRAMSNILIEPQSLAVSASTTIYENDNYSYAKYLEERVVLLKAKATTVAHYKEMGMLIKKMIEAFDRVEPRSPHQLAIQRLKIEYEQEYSRIQLFLHAEITKVK